MCPNSIPERSPVIVQRTAEGVGVQHQQARLVTVKQGFSEHKKHEYRITLTDHQEIPCEIRRLMLNVYKPFLFWESCKQNLCFRTSFC